jgi:PAS domain S-box-containing protein
MPRAKPSPLPPAGAPLDPLFAGAQATLAALPESAVLTRDKWEGGGVEVLFANERFKALTGYSAEDLAGQNTRLLHGPKTDLLAARTSSHSPWDPAVGENWLHRKDGVPFYAGWEFRPLASGLLIGVYHDLSELRRFREAMIHSQKLDTVGQLAGGVAHDFNNLLSIINGYCEILAGKIVSLPAAQKDLQEVHRAGLKAAGIARQILEFSRRQETEARVVNPNTLIREIADILRRAMGDAVKVELRLSSDLGNTRVDPTQFQQVLLNLCFNARDAMPQGGKLTLRTFNRSEGGASPVRGVAGSFVGIEVRDTGQGMDAVTRGRMFEPFFTTKPHGTGLGLAMARGVVRGAGGEISVTSKPEVGTVFEILLPETAEPEQVFSTALPALQPAGGTETLWLIEEDVVLRKMVSGILTVDGYRVHEFPQVASALAGKNRALPDLVLLDASVAEAAKLLQQLAAKQPRLKVLALSAESAAPAAAGLAPRALGHLPKPFALSTLLRSVRALLDNQRR